MAKKLIAVALATVMILSMLAMTVSAASYSTGTYKVSSNSGVSLNYASITMNEDSTKQLTATVSPSNATNKSVTWSIECKSNCYIE